MDIPHHWKSSAVGLMDLPRRCSRNRKERSSVASSAIALQCLKLELLGHETSRRKQMRAGPLEVAQWNVCR